jgi:hypothetical protein
MRAIPARIQEAMSGPVGGSTAGEVSTVSAAGRRLAMKNRASVSALRLANGFGVEPARIADSKLNTATRRLTITDEEKISRKDAKARRLKRRTVRRTGRLGSATPLRRLSPFTSRQSPLSHPGRRAYSNAGFLRFNLCAFASLREIFSSAASASFTFH